MTLDPVTRGPEQTHINGSLPLDAEGPLVYGPLGPLVQRVELGALVAASLETRWEADAGRSFRCPIPGHTGTARLVDQGGDLRLGCCTGRWRSLGEVRAAEAYGRDELRSNIELATWTRMVAYEAGSFAPLSVEISPLPHDASDHVQRAYSGFELLIGLRWRDGEHRPVAFAVRFCAAWCGLTHRDAHLAIQELRRIGTISEVERIGQIRLYLPGRIGTAR
jgi:hypothetical protein